MEEEQGAALAHHVGREPHPVGHDLHLVEVRGPAGPTVRTEQRLEPHREVQVPGELQAMLQEGLKVECNLRIVVESVWFDDTANGHFDLAVGAVVSTLLDPSDYFNAWYRTGGPQNYSSWHNEKFDALIPEIDKEVDPTKRLALVRQAEAIMEQDPPVLPISWEQINDVWWNYVRGHNPYDYFGIYDVVRLDTFWLDK